MCQLPQTIRSTDRDVSLFFRVSRPLGKVRCTVTSGTEQLASVVRLKAAPGEMERIDLKAEALAQAQGDITVTVEELA